MTHGRERLTEMLDEAASIAVVGASSDPQKAAHRIPSYLQDQGYRIIPVNPNADEVLGEPTVDRLADVGEPVDIVDVFRPADEAPDIARQAAELDASVLWLQSGIRSEEAREVAEDAGLDVVMDRCLGSSHRILSRS